MPTMAAVAVVTSPVELRETAVESTATDATNLSNGQREMSLPNREWAQTGGMESDEKDQVGMADLADQEF
jgi:hypothetical protein